MQFFVFFFFSASNTRKTNETQHGLQSTVIQFTLMENSVAQSNTTVVSIQDDTQINSSTVYEYVKKENRQWGHSRILSHQVMLHSPRSVSGKWIISFSKTSEKRNKKKRTNVNGFAGWRGMQHSIVKTNVGDKMCGRQTNAKTLQRKVIIHATMF